MQRPRTPSLDCFGLGECLGRSRVFWKSSLCSARVLSHLSTAALVQLLPPRGTLGSALSQSPTVTPQPLPHPTPPLQLPQGSPCCSGFSFRSCRETGVEEQVLQTPC